MLSQKAPSKDVGAFDGIDRGQTENVVMGSGESGLHFAQVSRDVISEKASSYAKLSGWSDDYGAAGYDDDFAAKDSVGIDTLARVDLYNPMYYRLEPGPHHGGALRGRVDELHRLGQGVARVNRCQRRSLGLEPQAESPRDLFVHAYDCDPFEG